MNKIRVIDLLNKIANGEEVPKKIHINQFQDNFIFNGYTYLRDDEEAQNIYWYLHTEALNYEVEILEEEKKIPEQLNYPHIEIESSADDEIRDYLYKVKDKFDEIIDYLKSKGDE